MVATISYGQNGPTNTGSLQLGGQAAFSSDGSSSDGARRYTKLQVNPSVQYFILPGLSLGGAVTLDRTSGRFGSITNWGAGPAASYYFGSHESRVRPFASATGGILRVQQHPQAISESGFSLRHETVPYYRVSGGALLMLSRGVGLSSELYYRQEFRDIANVNSFGVGLGIVAFVF
jgi:hypothetical protein